MNILLFIFNSVFIKNMFNQFLKKITFRSYSQFMNML